MVLGGWGSVNLSHLFTLHPPKFGIWEIREIVEKGEVDLLQPWSDFDPNPLVGSSIFLVWLSEPTLAIWSERLAQGPYQKNTPPAVGLEPAILRSKLLPTELSWPPDTRALIDSMSSSSYKTEEMVLGGGGRSTFCFHITR